MEVESLSLTGWSVFNAELLVGFSLDVLGPILA